MTTEKLWMAFKHFDVDDTGYITEQNLIEAFANAGKDFTQEEVQQMIQEGDKLKDSRISFNEFQAMMAQEIDKSRG